VNGEAVMGACREKLKGPWVKALEDVTAYEDALRGLVGRTVTRAREAAPLSEVLGRLELVREKRPQYRELIGQMMGKRRTVELAPVMRPVMRMAAEGPGKN
jgi:hypothetical protein